MAGSEGFSTEQVQAYTQLAQQAGPFAFSILYITVIVWMAHRFNASLADRPSPPDPSERQQYRHFFYAAFVSAITFTVVSIIWWIYSNTLPKVYRFAVEDLGLAECVSAGSDDTFTQLRMKQVGPMMKRDFIFVVVREQTLNPGDTIGFTYWDEDDFCTGGKGSVKYKSLQGRYDGKRITRLRYHPDKNELRLVEGDTGAGQTVVATSGSGREVR